jgi:hypothetical protein
LRALAVMTMPAALAAGSANAQLVVGVTVVRSCVIDAQTTSSTDSRLKLSCAAGAMSSLQTQGTTKIEQSGTAADLLAPTAPVSQSTTQSDLRVLTLNF